MKYYRPDILRFEKNGTVTLVSLYRWETVKFSLSEENDILSANTIPSKFAHYLCNSQAEGAIQMAKDGKNIWSRLTSQNESLDLYLIPTRRCNFACKYCFMENNIDTIDLSEITLNNLITWILAICRTQNLHKVYINLYGGEPFFPQVN